METRLGTGLGDSLARTDFGSLCVFRSYRRSVVGQTWLGRNVSPYIGTTLRSSKKDSLCFSFFVLNQVWKESKNIFSSEESLRHQGVDQGCLQVGCGHEDQT